VPQEHLRHETEPRRQPARFAAFRDRRGNAESEAWLHPASPHRTVDLAATAWNERGPTVHRDADKRRSQVSFLNETPQAALQDLADWALAHGLEAAVGSYSDKEFFLDAPDAFVDFVIEAMTPDLADYGVAE
jgi:hypothetical protein